MNNPAWHPLTALRAAAVRRSVRPQEAVQHFRDARAACDELFVRHGESGGTVENEENEETEVKIAEKMPQLQARMLWESEDGRGAS